MRRAAIKQSADEIALLITQTAGTMRLTTADERATLAKQGVGIDYVVLVYLRPLLADGGVLDQLVKRGFKVENPVRLGEEKQLVLTPTGGRSK